MKITIEVNLDLTDAMKEKGIKKLTVHEQSLFEYFVEVQLEKYNPAEIISRLELKDNEPLAKIFRQGFEITASMG
jgi:hypothetical protein